MIMIVRLFDENVALNPFTGTWCHDDDGNYSQIYYNRLRKEWNGL